MTRFRVVLVTVLLAGCASAPTGVTPAPLATIAPSVDATGPATTSSASAAAPSASAPAGWIAYYDMGSGSASADGLSLIRADGTDAHPFLADGSRSGVHADWSPDGQRLVYVEKKANAKPEIWIADRDGTHRRLLVDCEDPCADMDDPAWSPDGKRIVFYRFTNDFNDGQWLEIVDVETGKVARKVHPSDLLKGPSRARWSPDGKHLAVEVGDFVPDGTDYRQTGSAIGVVDLTAAKPTIRLITKFDLLAFYPAWSPAGDRIVFMAGNLDASQGGPVSDLWTVRPDGSELTQITHLPSGQGLYGPDWTAGEHPILVTLYHSPDDFNLATLDADGTNMTDVVAPDTGKPIRGVHARWTATES